MRIDIRRPELMDKAMTLKCTEGEIYGTWDGAVVVAIALSEADIKALNKPSEMAGADALFEQFWKLYPRRVARFAASKVFAKLPAADKRAALATMPNFSAMWKWELEHGNVLKGCPHATTWLNEKRWLDDQWEEPMVSSKGKGAYGYGK